MIAERLNLVDYVLIMCSGLLLLRAQNRSPSEPVKL